MSKLDDLTYASTPTEVAAAIVEELLRRGYTYDEAIGVIADGLQESGLQMVWSKNRLWFNYYQQDASYPNRENPKGAVMGFLDRLDVKRKSAGHGDIWLNIFWLQQRPSDPSAQTAYDRGRKDYLIEIKSRTAAATAMVDRFWPLVTVVPGTGGGGGGGVGRSAGTPVAARLADPVTKELWTVANRYLGRNGMKSPMWIGCHTSESLSRAVNLRNFCENNEVSYNRIGDDVDIVGMVRDADGPWAAMGANNYAWHYCWSYSFAGWSRGQWLDEDAGNDGFNERAGLKLGAKQIAYWIQESRELGRAIPVEWIGGRNRPPWGLNGICGHVDFGQWGGGHQDPGVNFPVDVLMADVKEWLGMEPPVIIAPPPVTLPGTNPDQYADWMLYKGNSRNDVDRVMKVQTALNKQPFLPGLSVDGDFGALTRAAVIRFQDVSGLVVDGIVGPMTAAALKP